MGDFFEECGVFGIYLKPISSRDFSLVPRTLYTGLSALQHRGQLSSGVAIYNDKEGDYQRRINVLKGAGKVDDLFRVKSEFKNSQIIKALNGVAGIGHVRYSTSGDSGKDSHILLGAQPFHRRHGRLWKRFAMCFNGNVVNSSFLKEDFIRGGYHFDTPTDTEVIMHMLSKRLKFNSEKFDGGRPDLFDVQKDLMNELDGSFCLLELFADGRLIAVRDPHGFKPLVWGETDEFYAVASESVALKKIGITKFQDVLPGECLIFSDNGVSKKRFFEGGRISHCHFEEVYFSKRSSVNNGVSVNLVRKNLGINLALTDPLRSRIKSNPSEFVVVPIPNTANTAAQAYANEMSIPFEFAIEKLKGERGFINGKDVRKRIMDTEYSIFPESIRDKCVILIDDSIVRGETSRKVMSQLRNLGIKEIHLRSTEPPIRFPCFYGVDFPTKEELISNQFSNISEMEKFLGVDSLFFQSLDGLVGSLGIAKERLCLACLDGKYPTFWGKKFGAE